MNFDHKGGAVNDRRHAHISATRGDTLQCRPAWDGESGQQELGARDTDQAGRERIGRARCPALVRGDRDRYAEANIQRCEQERG